MSSSTDNDNILVYNNNNTSKKENSTGKYIDIGNRHILRVANSEIH